MDDIIKIRDIPPSGRGGTQCFETLRIPDFLGIRITDGDEIVSLTRRPSFSPPEDSWYSFQLEADSTQGDVLCFL
jgi:hypothetical protein